VVMVWSVCIHCLYADTLRMLSGAGRFQLVFTEPFVVSYQSDVLSVNNSPSCTQPSILKNSVLDQIESQDISSSLFPSLVHNSNHIKQTWRNALQSQL